MQCLSNMRQIGIGLQAYLGEADGWIPHARVQGAAAQAVWGKNMVVPFSHEILGSYLGTPVDGGPNFDPEVALYRCPRRDPETAKQGNAWRVSYSWNAHIGNEVNKPENWPGRNTHIARVQGLSETVIMLERDSQVQYRFFAVSGNPPDLVDQWSPRHKQGCNMLFLDGHVRFSPHPGVESQAGTASFRVD